MSETPVKPELTAARIAALAVRLDAAPRSLLALAATRASGNADQRERIPLDLELARVGASDAAANAVELLLLGYAPFAVDDVDRALELVWSGIDLGRG